MKSLITVLTTLSLLLATCAGSFTSTAQLTNLQDPFEAGNGFTRKLPPNAVIGSTPERKAAWDSLTPEQKETVLTEYRTIIENLQNERQQEGRREVDSTLAFTDDNGQRLLVTAKAREVSKSNVEAESAQTSTPCFDCEPCPECEPNPCLINPSSCEPVPSPTPTPAPTPSPTPSKMGRDADQDGLPEKFENTVASAFTPFYHVSAGERSGTGFASFGNFVPQTVQQVFGPVPPISYFRVKPAGFRTDANGNQWGFLQLDYLTLWNRDDGLATGGLCEGLSLSLGFAGYTVSQILPAITDHPLDNERSAVLIAAPVSSPNTYNFEPQAYKAYLFFTAAHEDTLVDQSRILSPSQPVPAGHHIELAFSLSKHGTYHFNPDWLPMMPDYIIFATYATLSFLYMFGYISGWEYLAYLYIADITYFVCVVERFHEQGGVFAGTHINVGDLNIPTNNSNFIRDTQLTRKLSKMFNF
ncbi:MAG TPA: hypothetical protein VFS76_05280 [Pyrinomonadaceae bacterium]|nr:hypothetical protein [Pyrinomonadaceae bacterium]